MGNCLNCGVGIGEGITKEKEFCSTLCRSKYNGRIRYEKLKENPEFKEKAKLRFKNWYERNKDKHKAYMKDYMREYYRRKISKKVTNETTIV